MTRQETLQLYEKFFNGDRDAIYEEYIRARTSELLQREAAGTPAEQEIMIPEYEFRMRNCIRDIIEKRIDFMPQNYEVKVLVRNTENETLTRILKEWLSKPIVDGKTLDQMLPYVFKYQEIFGYLPIKFYTVDPLDTKTPEPRLMIWPSDEVTIVTDPMNVQKISSIMREYETSEFSEDKNKTTKYREVITPQSYAAYVNGKLLKETPHSYGVIPVAVIQNEYVLKSPYGSSTVEKLIDPQNDINDAETKRATLTKYNSFRVWAPKEKLTKMPETRIRIFAGAFSPIPLESVGGDISSAAVEEEIEKATIHIYELGKVMRPVEDKTAMGQISGDALERMLVSLVNITRTKVQEIESGLEFLFELLMKTVQGEQDIKVNVSFEKVDFKDDAYKLQMATTLYSWGYKKLALGLITGLDDENLETMIKDQEKEAAKKRVQDEKDDETKIDEYMKNVFNAERKINGQGNGTEVN